MAPTSLHRSLSDILKLYLHKVLCIVQSSRTPLHCKCHILNCTVLELNSSIQSKICCADILRCCDVGYRGYGRFVSSCLTVLSHSTHGEIVIMIVQYYRGWLRVRKVCPLATRKPSLSPWFRVSRIGITIYGCHSSRRHLNR